MPPTADFSGQRVTVMGLGLLGRGVNDVRFLAGRGARLTVTDLKDADALAPSLERLADLEGIRYVLGEHRLEDFRDADLVLKAAGVPRDSPFVAEARAHGVPVEMDESLFAQLSDATLVGVTGTRGKTTTTLLLHAMLERAGVPVHLGGNILDTATLPLLDVARPGDPVVLELSSWQLQGFGDARISPHVAVFTNFLPDHLNYYGGDMDAYFADKANVFRFQRPADVLVASPGAAAEIARRHGPVVGLRVVDANALDPAWRMLVPGRHNRLNAALAAEAARAVGAPEEAIRAAVESFRGAPERLELVRELAGVRWYDDTTATTPDALVAALEAVGAEATGIVLIAGGADKGLDYAAAAGAIDARVRTLVALPGAATDKLLPLLQVEVVEAGSMEEAVHTAAAVARMGDAVLLSPGAASFGLFVNEFDRGARFVAAVNALV